MQYSEEDRHGGVTAHSQSADRHSEIARRLLKDDAIGIIRCVQCGHRLDGEIECPLCASYYDNGTDENPKLPKWIYLTAYFMTSPLSAGAIIKNQELNFCEKVVALSGAFFWFYLFIYFL